MKPEVIPIKKWELSFVSVSIKKKNYHWTHYI